MNELPHTTAGRLRRSLNLLDCTMINAGSMIGSGIFLVPVTVAMYLQSPLLVVLAWIVGGIVSLFGALSVAELGSMYPKAGGQYVFLTEAYGPLWGFLYGWTAFVVIMTASISAVAVGFSTYLAYFIPLTDREIKLVAIASIAVLTAVNCLGVKLGALLQNIMTFYKIATLVVLAIAGVLFGAAGAADAGPAILFPGGVAGSFGLALLAVLWAYDGWIEITYVAGEVQDPERNIPRSIIISTLLVVALYVLVNIAYLRALTLDEITSSTLVAADAAAAVLGAAGGVFAVVGVIVSTLGTNNGFILTGARIYYAMAAERYFFSPLAGIHPRFGTPVPSLIAQGVWAAVLVFTSTFDQLITYVIFASWIFYGMCAGAVMVLRARDPHRPRPYRTWGYPVTPVVFILFSLYLIADTVIENPSDAAVGIGIVLLGIPVFLHWRRRRA